MGDAERSLMRDAVASVLFAVLSWVPVARAQVASAIPEAETRHVEIWVHRPDGTPVVGVPIYVGGQYDGLPPITDSDGRAVFQRGIPDDWGFVPVGVSWTHRHRAAFPRVYPSIRDWQDEQKAQKVNYGELRYVRLPATGGIEATIVVRPAVTITGRLVDEDGRPLGGSMQARGGCVIPGGYADAETGAFAIHGVAAGDEAELFFNVSGHRLLSHIVAPATEDRDLGDVVVKTPSGPTGRVLVRVQRSGQSIDYVVPANGVTFVSMDGSTMYCGPVIGRDGYVFKSFAEEVPLTLPVGTYWLVPGLFLSMDWQIGILDGIRGGDAEITRTLQRVKVVEDELFEVTILTSDAASAIERLIPQE